MEKNALDLLYQEYHRELELYLISLCGSHALAEDLLQEIFLKALLSLPPGHPNVRAWLYQVGRNLYFDHRKKNGRLVSGTEQTESEKLENPEEQLLRDEQSRALYRALARMEERKKEVLILQYFAGLSQKEISGVLGIRPDYVRVLVCRAKKELKREMEAEGYDVP